MAQEIVGLKIQVDGSEATKSVGSIKQELKEANAELIKAQTEFGDYSTEAVNAAKKVAKLKDSIAEASETAQLFDPGKKFQVFAGALSAVAGGFTAVQGALGLVGVESENVQKSLLKVQSALALSQGLSTVADSVKDFQRLAAVIQQSTIFTKAFQMATIAATAIQRAFGIAVTTTSTAFKVLRGAILASGIGALVIGVGLLVNKIIDWTNRSSEAEKAQKKLADSTKVLNQDIDNQISILTALGGKENEIYKLRLQRNENELNVLRNKLKTTGKLNEEELAQYKKLETEKKVLDIQEQNRIKKNQEEEAKNRKTAYDKESEDRRKRLEKEAEEEKEILERQLEARKALLQFTGEEIRKFEKQQDDENKKREEEKRLQNEINTRQDLARRIAAAEEVNKALSVITANNIQKSRDQYAASLNFEIESSNLSYQEQERVFQQLRELERQKLVDRKATQSEFDLFDKQSKEQERKRDEAAAQTKAAVISGALGTIADAVGRNTIAGKSLAVAQASVDTYAGANKALATYPPPFGAIAAGTVILAGLLNVKKIISTKIPPPPGSKGITDNVAASVSTAAPIAPTAPLINTRTQLDATTIQQMGSATNRAYVLESDVTNSQERIRRINRAARLA